MAKEKFYFGTKEEKSIKDYVLSTDHNERERIYVKEIRPVFAKLCENIIFRYDFLRLGTTYNELHNEVMGHLYLNLDKFKPEYGFKAYSYFGTSAKRYLQQKSINKTFESKNMDSINENEQKDNGDHYVTKELIVEDDQKNVEDKELISLLLDYFLNKETNSQEEAKITEAISYFLHNYETINIHNKKHLYILLREYTGLDTKTITKIMNSCIINCYNEIKNNYINYKI